MTALPVDRREIAMDVWRSLLNEPYRWMGSDPLQGFDCSGFVIEGLKAAGILPREGDWTAAQLAARFPTVAPNAVGPGCLVFWIRGGTIGHVEVVYAVLGDTVFTIGASGGGSTTTSEQAAADADAYVKIRPAVSGWVNPVNPFKGLT